MRIPRQGGREARFRAALSDMPRFETWTTEHVNADGEAKERQHVKMIARRVRRDMARQRSQRDYRRDHQLPEPILKPKDGGN